LPGGDYSARFFLTVPFSELRLAAELFLALTCEGFKQIEIHDEFLSTKPGFATARRSAASTRGRGEELGSGRAGRLGRLGQAGTGLVQQAASVWAPARIKLSFNFIGAPPPSLVRSLMLSDLASLA
jgi:hypothetical protein